MTNESQANKIVYKPNPSQEQTGTFFPHQLVPKLWNKRMRNINLKFKIRNLKFQVLDI